MSTTCTKCGSFYETGSEEQASKQERLCPSCQPRQEPITVFCCGGFEKCKEGEDHDWGELQDIPGWENCQGRICKKCGVDNISHSLWYDE